MVYLNSVICEDHTYSLEDFRIWTLTGRKGSTVTIPRQFNQRGPAHTIKGPWEDPGSTMNPTLEKSFHVFCEPELPQKHQILCSVDLKPGDCEMVVDGGRALQPCRYRLFTHMLQRTHVMHTRDTLLNVGTVT